MVLSPFKEVWKNTEFKESLFSGETWTAVFFCLKIVDENV